MNAKELAKKINKLIETGVEGNEEEWLAVDKELIEFNNSATDEEKAILHEECPKGEMFCIVALGIAFEKKANEEFK